ncbi:MAG TPA: ankyrin repeat domain-containing protein, partial [Candidatus Hydrogenedentes bacterium]|nr:ankyrin repeat domain-containing protein [Candidatus Hydrogenedentota bacterium]
VQVFIGEGADINAADINGFTPLHIAAEQGHVRMVKLLMSRGANVNLRNSEGRTPLKIAQDSNNDEVAALLRPATESAFSAALNSGDVAGVKRFLEDCRSGQHARTGSCAVAHRRPAGAARHR